MSACVPVVAQRTCAACGDVIEEQRRVLCSRCVEQPAGQFTWPRVICRACGADVAVTPKGWTAAHTDRRKRLESWNANAVAYNDGLGDFVPVPEVRESCPPYKVDDHDPTLRPPRIVSVDYHSIRRKTLPPSQLDAAKAVVQAAESVSDHDARGVEVLRAAIESLRDAIRRRER